MWDGPGRVDSRIPEPIRQAMRILATHRALFGDRGYPQRGRPALNEAEISRVVDIFNASNARWSLVGAYAVTLVTEPRSTADFDFIIDDAAVDDVLRGLTEVFGPLQAHDAGVEMRLTAIDVDLIRSTFHPLFAVALEQPRTIGDWRAPHTEVLVILKFMAAVSRQRSRADRMGDYAAIGFIHSAAQGSLDLERMVELSRLVYPGADAVFGDLISKLDLDEPISI